jgi:hypothetical protein
MTTRPPLARRIRNRIAAIRQRLGDAWHILTAPHYIMYFDRGRPIPASGHRGMNGGWRGLRRQDVYDVGTWCLEMLAEDDEASSLVDEANDLLNN